MKFRTRTYHGSVRGILLRTGGIRPPQRTRSRLALTLAEREEISRAIVAGESTTQRFQCRIALETPQLE